MSKSEAVNGMQLGAIPTALGYRPQSPGISARSPRYMNHPSTPNAAPIGNSRTATIKNILSQTPVNAEPIKPIAMPLPTVALPSQNKVVVSDTSKAASLATTTKAAPPQQMSTYSAPPKLDIEKLLVQNGYTIISKYTIRNDESALSVIYLKCYNSDSHTIFVMLDVDGSIGLMSDDIDKTIVSVSESSSIDHSIKNSASECVSTLCSGVALQCTDELCTILRENDGSTNQTSFISSDSDSTKTNPLVYPIVRLSEIITDPNGALSRVSAVSTRIFAEAMKRSEAAYASACVSSASLTASVMFFTESRAKLLTKMQDEIKTLELYRKGYNDMKSNNDITPKDTENIKTLPINVYARNYAIERAISLTDEFANYIQKMQEITVSIEGVAAKLSGYFDAISEKGLTLEDIKKITEM